MLYVHYEIKALKN